MKLPTVKLLISMTGLSCGYAWFISSRKVHFLLKRILLTFSRFEKCLSYVIWVSFDHFYFVIFTSGLSWCHPCQIKPFHKDINIFKSEWDRLHFQSARDDGHRLCLRAKKGDFCTGDDTSAAITSYQGRLTVIGMASIRQKNCKKSGNGS